MPPLRVDTPTAGTLPRLAHNSMSSSHGRWADGRLLSWPTRRTRSPTALSVMASPVRTNAHGPSDRRAASGMIPNRAANKITTPATTLTLPTTSSRSVAIITVQKPTARMNRGHAPRTRSMAQACPADASISSPPIATSASPVSTLERGVAAPSSSPAPGIAGSCEGIPSSRTELDRVSRSVGDRGPVGTRSRGHDATSPPSRLRSGSRRRSVPV